MYFPVIQCKMRMRLKPLFLWTILIVGMTVLVIAEGTKTNRHHIILKKLFKDKNFGKLLPVTLLIGYLFAKISVGMK